MTRHSHFLFFLVLCVVAISCQQSSQSSKPVNPAPAPSQPIHAITEVPPVNENGSLNALIEIPAGTLEKWEMNKTTGTLEWDKENNKPRVIEYLGYPGNYGMIPGTHLSKESGGDGDPLDILVLGPPVQRGEWMACHLIGVLHLTDQGERDDKMIAIANNSTLENINSISDLKDRYPGVSEILELWFTHYKGRDKMIFQGFGERSEAKTILDNAIKEYTRLK